MSVEIIKRKLERMSERERILLLILIGTLCLLITGLSFGLIHHKSSSMKEQIERNEQILRQIKHNETRLQQYAREKELSEKRFSNAPDSLSALLDKLAGEVELEIPELRELPDEIIRKKWIEKSVEIRLRKINLEKIVNFMVKIKNQNRKFPLAITKLNIRKRSGEGNSFDVKMKVSTYTKKGKKKKQQKQKQPSKPQRKEQKKQKQIKTQPPIYGPKMDL